MAGPNPHLEVGLAVGEDNREPLWPANLVELAVPVA